MSLRITFIGAGAWGTALAIAACRLPGQRQVRLHVRDAEQAQAIARTGVNARYLPELPLPAALQVLSGPLNELTAYAAAQDLFIVATPMAGLRQALTALAAVPSSVAWLCKGFESGTGLMPHEVQAQVAPGA